MNGHTAKILVTKALLKHAASLSEAPEPAVRAAAAAYARFLRTRLERLSRLAARGDFRAENSCP
jgi:hypothetical protein